MFKRRKVVMLPTKEKALIFANKYQKLGIYNGERGLKEGGTHDPPYYNNKHLYIISDDEIKKGDWCIMLDSVGNVFSNPQQYTDPNTQHLNKGLRKIIATTNSSLGAEPNELYPEWNRLRLPQPSQAFIEVFVKEYNKGNIITDVLVEYKGKYRTNPDGEPIGLPVHDYQPKVNSKDNTITIKKVKDSWNKEEVENLIKSVVKEISYGNEELLHHSDGDFKELDEWINKNL